jgi:hypothetical protein
MNLKDSNQNLQLALPRRRNFGSEKNQVVKHLWVLPAQGLQNQVEYPTKACRAVMMDL